METKYHSFKFMIRSAFGTKNIEVLSTSLDAARAELAEAFTNLEIITVACNFSR